jgi:uncharacterized membrane protein (UPF0127 family)
MRQVIITNQSNPQSTSIRAGYCSSFWCRLRGLMFQPNIKKQEGLLLVENSEDRINTSIHMLFMQFDITAVWINSKFQVVDKTFAKRWRLAYIPSVPAQYILETHPDHLSEFNPGDQLTFSYE